MPLLKTVVRRAVELRGTNPLHDRLSLLLWEAYALARGGLHGAVARARSRRMGLPSSFPQSPLAASVASPAAYRNHVLSSVLPFWERHGVDRKHGGFTPYLDRAGRCYQADGDKLAKFQARLVYAFAVGYRLAGSQGHLRMAQHGLEFLLEHLWDRHAGGWYFSAHFDGTVARAEKNLHHQGCVLHALLEYFSVTRDPTILEVIRRTFELVQAHAWDRGDLGYYGVCDRRWKPVSQAKSLRVQLAMMAALHSLGNIGADPEQIETLRRIALVVSTRMRDPRYGCFLEICRPDWTYDPLATRDRVQIGHNLKAARLLLETVRLTGDETFLGTARTVLDFCLRYGWDRRNGGFCDLVYRNGILASHDKLWWPQCEGMSALLLARELTREESWFACFQATAGFALGHLADPVYGEWFTACFADGSPKDTTKSDATKAAFHNIEACLYATRYLDTQVPTGGQESSA